MERQIFDTCRQMMTGFSKLLGPDTELALHDLKTRELVYIVNGGITGRDAGYRMESSVYDAILELVDENGLVIGYPSRSREGKTLRASHIVLRDADGKPAALLCINQDTSKWEAVRDLIDAMISSRSISGPEETPDFSENYIQTMTRRVIMDVVEQAKPVNLENKEVKLGILQKLESKGVFSVKDAVPIVCKTLSISQATLYNYLRELRSRETFG